MEHFNILVEEKSSDTLLLNFLLHIITIIL